MDTYLYPKVLIDFLKRKPTEEEEEAYPQKKMDWLSFLLFLKKGTNLFVNLNPDNHDYKSERDPLNKIIPLLTTGRDKTLFVTDSNKFAQLNLTTTSRFQFQSPSNLICFDDSIDDIQTRKENNGVLIWTLNDYYKKWLEIKKIESENKKGLTIGNDGIIKKWSDLKFLQHPCSEVIISDRYLLKNEFRSLYTIVEILNNFFFIKQQVPKILIVSTIKEVFEKDINLLFEKISSRIIDRGLKVDLSLAIDRSNTIQHDRKIISNYFYFDSGDSWDYFEPNGTLKTKGTKINVLPLFGNSGINVLQQSLREVKAVIENNNTLKAGSDYKGQLVDLLATKG